MLKLLRVNNIALIPSLEIDLGPGLTLLTGETGAGKSILIDALGLLLGNRASAELIRELLTVPDTRFYGNPGNDGSGLKLAMSVGAQLVRMNRMVGRGVMRRGRSSASAVPSSRNGVTSSRIQNDRPWVAATRSLPLTFSS